MCYGENMPLDVLFVRDDDIPDLVQEDVCDLGLVGLNVVQEKRLAFAARGVAPLFETVQLLDFGRCRLCIAVPDGFEYRGAASLQGKRIATTYPHILGRFLADHGIAAEVVVLSGLRGNRPAARPGGSDLRSGVDRIHAGGESSAPGRNRARQPGGADPHARADRRGEAGVDPAAADAHRRRRTGQGQQVHHAARAPLRAAGHREAAAGQRGADGHSSRGPGRPGGGARRMPRERVLGDARGARRAWAPVRCWCFRSRKCWPRAGPRSCAFSTGNRCPRRNAIRPCGVPAQRDAAATQDAARGIIDAVRRDGDAAVLALTEKFDAVRPDSLRGDAAGIRGRRARA